MKDSRHYLMAGAMALFVSFGAHAQDKLSKDDQKFIKEAGQGNATEVEMGKLAQQNGASEGVKQFGQRLAADHGKANEELKQIADKHGVSLAAEPHQKDIDKFSKLKGAQFDKAFAEHMVKDHKKDIAKFRTEAKKGKSADVKTFASNALPTLEEHLKLAQGLTGAGRK